MLHRMIKGIAGSFILISLALSIYVNQNWLWFTAFVGANLFQSSLTLLQYNYFFTPNFFKMSSIKHQLVKDD